VRHSLHQSSNTQTHDRSNPIAPQQKNDGESYGALVAILSAYSLYCACWSKLLHERCPQHPHHRRIAHLGLRASGGAALANLGQPVLSHEARLFNGQFSELPQSRLVPFARIRAILKHEHPAPRRSNLVQETGGDGIPQFNRRRLKLRHCNNSTGKRNP